MNMRYSTFAPLFLLPSGEAFPQIQEKTGVRNYNVRLTVSINKEGEEDKEVVIKKNILDS